MIAYFQIQNMSFLVEECFWVDSFCKRLIDKFLTSTNLVKNFWSYRSIRNIQIATNCSVFDRFCFLCVVCLFWWFYGFLRWVFAIEKLEYSRYNGKRNNNSFAAVLIVVVWFLILRISRRFCLSFVWLKFSSFGLSYDGWRNKE